VATATVARVRVTPHSGHPPVSPLTERRYRRLGKPSR